MGFFNKYPYTDYHELNLDFIINEIANLHKDWDDFKIINEITAGGSWDITKQYKAWTIVDNNSMGYVSIKPVPVGVPITDESYWKLMADYSVVIAGITDRIIELEQTINGGEAGQVLTVDKEWKNVNPFIEHDIDIYRSGNTTITIAKYDKAKYSPKLYLSEAGEVDDLDEITQNVNASTLINAGIFDMGTNLPMGITILDSYTRKDYNSNVKDYLYFNGELKTLQNSTNIDTDYNDITSDDAIWCITGWGCSIKNNTEVWTDASYEPRTLIGFDNSYYYLINLGGGSKDERGLNMRKTLDFLYSINIHPVMLYQLDGGGSTYLSNNGVRVSKIVDNESRKVPSAIYFAKTDSIENQNKYANYNASKQKIDNVVYDSVNKAESISNVSRITVSGASTPNMGITFMEESTGLNNEIGLKQLYATGYVKSANKLYIDMYDGTNNVTAIGFNGPSKTVEFFGSQFSDIIKVIDASKAYSIASQGSFNFNPANDFAIPDGYTCLGIIGYSTNDVDVVVPGLRFINSAYGIQLRNVSTRSISNTFNAKLLVLKNI